MQEMGTLTIKTLFLGHPVTVSVQFKSSYVHRLILNKHDGKFVEIAPPNTISGERSQIPPTTSEQDQENEHRKLEKLAVEYNWLLKRLVCITIASFQ